ncbi:MAG: hypothetical protein LBT40_03620 [Deltaproteobacteria bacterium]|jgi:predicted RNA-binding Zn-ribbon protein involved in translation (DUF1610 family)|nr:hypothetical protein [Deltaproteobacteria bacterium]
MASDSQITCPSCGGFIDVIPGQSKYTCPWCGNDVDLFRLQRQAGAQGTGAQGGQAPSARDIKLIVPFRADENALHSFVLHKAIENDYAPDDILSSGNVESKELLYLPFWEVTGSSEIDWTASFGYDRQEPYTAYETETRGGRTYQKAVTRYRTVTDWRPASGKARASFRARAYAGRDAAPQNVSDMLESGLLGHAAAPFAEAYLAGYSVEPFARTQEECRGRFDAQAYSAEDAEVRRHAQGDRQRDWHHSASRRYDAPQQCVLPLAKAVFSYAGSNYTIFADGVDMRLVSSDPFPRDTKRKGRVSRGFIPFWLSLVAGVVCACAMGIDYAHPAPIVCGVLAAIIYGFMRKSSILKSSRKIRQASLAQKRLDEYQQLGNLSNDEVQSLTSQAVIPKPGLLARTGGDLILIPLLTLAFAGAVMLGFLAF